MEKGEIARHEQFPLFPQCFEKKKRLVLKTRKNQGLFGKGKKNSISSFSPTTCSTPERPVALLSRVTIYLSSANAVKLGKI